MPKFRKKPVVIEAVRVLAADYAPQAVGRKFDGSPFSNVPDWLRSAIESGAVSPHSRNSTDYAEWDINTLEGVMNATPGDYIIRGVKGELYPCKPDIFAQTYDAC